MIACLSNRFGLKHGELVFIGTPAGIGPMVRGDRVCGGVDGVDVIETRVD